RIGGVRFSRARRFARTLTKYQLKVSLAAISRSYKRSLADNLEHSRSVSGSDYERFRKEVALRLQHRSYTRRLDRYKGIIQHYYFDMKIKPSEILDRLKSQGVKTSLSSIYRIIKVIREQKVKIELFKETKDICKGCKSGKGSKQSDVQLRAYLRAGNFPQL
ncbi:MAG: hypothetical protein RR736_23535, partial [Pseudomonas sp.]|uniref:hypothetical protein n=1 Tax=Pseudomonas sp. TaxID=306 RepID=UPI002FCCA42C